MGGTEVEPRPRQLSSSKWYSFVYNQWRRNLLERLVNEVLKLCNLAVLVRHPLLLQGRLEVVLDSLGLVLRRGSGGDSIGRVSAKATKSISFLSREDDSDLNSRYNLGATHRLALDLEHRPPVVLRLVHLHVQTLPRVHVPDVLEATQALETLDSKLSMELASAQRASRTETEATGAR